MMLASSIRQPDQARFVVEIREENHCRPGNGVWISNVRDERIILCERCQKPRTAIATTFHLVENHRCHDKFSIKRFAKLPRRPASSARSVGNTSAGYCPKVEKISPTPTGRLAADRIQATASLTDAHHRYHPQGCRFDWEVIPSSIRHCH